VADHSDPKHAACLTSPRATTPQKDCPLQRGTASLSSVVVASDAAAKSVNIIINITNN